MAFKCQVNDSEMWHKRLGHFHHKGLQFLQRNDMARGLPNLEEQFSTCKACLMGKQARFPFKESTWRATEKLQLIHSDLCGPQATPSLNGSRYFIIFIDDYTRMCWIYFMKQKLEVAKVFLKFKRWIENQSSCKIQVIRSDNGTEYTSQRFNSFCEEAGIEHQLTIPYSPQKNGVSERKNRTIMEMTRCLLHEKNLPKELWVEAANTTVFLLNKLPTRALEKNTPFEAWSGIKPL